MTDITPYPFTGYLAPDGFLEPLLEELGEAVDHVHGRLAFVPGPPRPVMWAQNTWINPVLVRFQSNGEAAAALKAIQRNWAAYAVDHHRRAALIEEKLPHVSAKPLVFPQAAPTAPLGSWTLLDRTTMIAAAQCSSPFRNGEVAFVEDREGPPSRAYLKLWEAFTVLGVAPGPGDRCIDLGACPGGWTWVLQRLGVDEVVAVDKAPLDPKVAALPGVTERLESAFGLRPGDVGSVDWLFSDVICYPARLLRLVTEWIEADLARNFICTIKFQGATDHETARAFAAIPGSRVLHLSVNKHELTWVRLASNL